MSNKYQEYNDMLNKLYTLHTDKCRIHLQIKTEEPLTDIQNKAVRHFVAKLRVQDWIIHVNEYIYKSEETHLAWARHIHIISIEGNLITAKL